MSPASPLHRLFHRQLALPMLLFVLTATACVDVEYARPGVPTAAREGQALVFGGIRFVHDGREHLPWRPSLLPYGERHVWLLRLDQRAVSAELHPDGDGSLAIWLARGDYALVGNAEKPGERSDYREVLALLRVPDGPAAVYAGDLVFRTEYREGLQVQHGLFGEADVQEAPLQAAVAAVEAKLGPLSGETARSPWCTGSDLPAFTDPDLAVRARRILGEGCPHAR